MTKIDAANIIRGYSRDIGKVSELKRVEDIYHLGDEELAIYAAYWYSVKHHDKLDVLLHMREAAAEHNDSFNAVLLAIKTLES